MSNKRPLLPYLDRGKRRPMRRKTSVDPPDRRVPEVHVTPITAKQLRARPPATHPLVEHVHLHFTRWSAAPMGGGGGIMGGHMPELSRVELYKDPEFGALPLQNAESLITDAALRAAPYWASQFVYWWYKDQLDPQEITDRLKMKRREQMYEYRHFVLFWWSGILFQIGLHIPV